MKSKWNQEIGKERWEVKGEIKFSFKKKLGNARERVKGKRVDLGWGVKRWATMTTFCGFHMLSAATSSKLMVK